MSAPEDARMDATRVTTVRLPEHLAQTLDLIARVDEVPLSEVIRVAAYTLIDARRADEAFMARVRTRIEGDARILAALDGTAGAR